jgi:hypothetical protein
MEYTCETSGGLSAFGCSDVDMDHYYTITYPIGTIIYFKGDAIKGKLTKVCIRDYKLLPDVDINGNNFCLYKDTFNALYNEEELINYSDAMDLINWYNDRISYIYQEQVRMYCQN